MSGLIGKIRGLISGDQSPPAEVVRHFQSALNERTRIELTPSKSLLADPPLIALSIVAVNERDFVVTQPAADAVRHLKRGRPFDIGFYDEQSRLQGEIECLGRTQFTDEHGHVLYTYRFSLPLSLRRQEPNKRVDSRFALTEKPSIELSAFDLKTPIYGEAIDLSRRGMQLRCQNAQNKLQVGQNVMLKVQLPEPIGALTERVRITHVETSADTPAVTIGVAFQRPLMKFDEWRAQGDGPSAIRRAG